MFIDGINHQNIRSSQLPVNILKDVNLSLFNIFHDQVNFLILRHIGGHSFPTSVWCVPHRVLLPLCVEQFSAIISSLMFFCHIIFFTMMFDTKLFILQKENTSLSSCPLCARILRIARIKKFVIVLKVPMPKFCPTFR